MVDINQTMFQAGQLLALVLQYRRMQEDKERIRELLKDEKNFVDTGQEKYLKLSDDAVIPVSIAVRLLEIENPAIYRRVRLEFTKEIGEAQKEADEFKKRQNYLAKRSEVLKELFTANIPSSEKMDLVLLLRLADDTNDTATLEAILERIRGLKERTKIEERVRETPKGRERTTILKVEPESKSKEKGSNREKVTLPENLYFYDLHSLDIKKLNQPLRR